ncbi:toprim domain-containing protein [Nitrosomonas sp.]|uniref:toprim domain-containing protein n=1 Tax=Nitrosomonas sp. TaxID=42353 RepID=UPI00374D0A43
MTLQIKNRSWGASANAPTLANSSANYTTCSIESQFRQAMQAAGIPYSGEVIADGKLHRVHIEGHKPGTLNGAYTLHLNGRPAGYFQDYKTGISQTWRSGNGCQSVSYAQIKQITESRFQRDAEERKKHEETAKRANTLWPKFKPINLKSGHAYLTAKRIQPHGARLYGDALVIPIFNESNQLVNLQFINPHGEKRFLSGGRKRGCFHIIGDLSQRILICEGFATGASLFEESGQRVVVAFDAGNLLPVAKNVRDLSPDTEIIICADNDVSGLGQTKGREAALAIGGKVMIPQEPGKDWNDMLTGGSRNA